jgi:hypothetical protein
MLIRRVEDAVSEVLNIQISLKNKLNKKEGKAVPVHAMKALGGRGGIAPAHSRPQH